MSALKISIITVFDELYDSFLNTSLIGRAQSEGHVTFNVFKHSDYFPPKERIDEPTCGPGAGMVLKPEVMQRAIEAAAQQYGPGYTIFFTPQGTPLTQNILRHTAKHVVRASSKQDASKPGMHIILVAGRYEGFDERTLAAYADAQISIGDYVLLGGDLPTQVFLEGLLRLLPGVVGSAESIEHESFEGPWLDYPVYGLPTSWEGREVPEVLLSGNHKAIEQWRDEQAAKNTLLKRFDHFSKVVRDSRDKELAQKLIPAHYVALMHSDVCTHPGREGNTSITSIDLHDIARSCATFGVKNFFAVTPLEDQQSIMASFLEYWHSKEGAQYNKSRYDAILRLVASRSFDEVVQAIEQKEGKKPIVVATSAQRTNHPGAIDFTSQGKVWAHNRPVLLLLGTGHGLTEGRLAASDYLLDPINGLVDYNHLSVRAAAGIILDRWLGLHGKKLLV